MAIQIPEYKTTPPIPHRDTFEHKCDGAFIFSGNLALDSLSERRCNRQYCRRQETYDSDHIILVACERVLEVDLRKFCQMLARKLRKLGNEKNVEDFPPVKVISDKSNPGRLAAIIEVKGLGHKPDPRVELEFVAARAREMQSPPPPAFQDVVEWIWRKPLSYFVDSDGSKKAVTYKL